MASTTVTRAPMPAAVDATSAPMNPAPITTTATESLAVDAARKANESSSVRKVNNPSAAPSASVPSRWRGAARWRR